MSKKRYIYPRLSKHDFFIIRFGGPGLGNLLFTYARAVVDSKKNCIPMIWPTWRSIKVGPYLRHERDKRRYSDLFDNNSGYVDGIKKVFLLLFNKRITLEEQDGGVIEYSGMDEMFNPIIDDYRIVKEDIKNNLQRQNRAALEYDFEDSISVHIRLGDFQRGTTEQLKAGNQNTSTPVEWYVGIVEQIRNEAGRIIKVYVFSDGTDAELKSLLELPGVQRITFGNSISDMLALSGANLLVACGSTFSMWARYLGRMNVIVHEGQLIQRLKREGDSFFEIEVADRIGKQELEMIAELFRESDNKNGKE